MKNDGTLSNKTLYDMQYRKEHIREMRVDVPKELYDEFIEIAKLNNKTKAELIKEFMKDYIAKNK